MSQRLTSNRTSTARRIAAIILAVTVVRVWIGGAFDQPRAQAQSPAAQVPAFDTSALARKQIEEAQKTNALLTDILKHLQTGTVNVRTQSTDKKGAPPPPPKDDGK